ncbi:MAG: response regulator transcription factor [Agriterribacter sp.]
MTTLSNLPITVAIAEDHPLMRRAIFELIKNTGNYHVNIVAQSGEELIDAMQQTSSTDIVILDINMPGMDGFETLSFIQKKFKKTKVIFLTIYNDITTILRIVTMGGSGYISKNAEPEDILDTISKVLKNGKYFPDLINDRLNEMNKSDIHKRISSITQKEFTFLKYACTGMPYKEIAAKMHVGRFTVDDYRNSLYEKLNIESRAELVLFTLKHKLVNIEL